MIRGFAYSSFIFIAPNYYGVEITFGLCSCDASSRTFLRSILLSLIRFELLCKQKQ
jgi:hypothetical protein